jgi:hypothetical protein
VLYCLTLITLSRIIDGPQGCIAVPFWSGQGNPRSAYTIMENKKIKDIIKEVAGKAPKAEEPASFFVNFQFITN